MDDDFDKVIRKIWSRCSSDELQNQADLLFKLARWLEVVAFYKRNIESKNNKLND